MKEPIIRHLDDVESNRADIVAKRLFGPNDDAAALMLHAAIPPGGASHEGGHSHRWHHAVFILSGSGVLRCGDKDYPVRAGQGVYVPPDIPHAFVNTGDEPLVRLTVNPPEAA